MQTDAYKSGKIKNFIRNTKIKSFEEKVLIDLLCKNNFTLASKTCFIRIISTRHRSGNEQLKKCSNQQYRPKSHISRPPFSITAFERAQSNQIKMITSWNIHKRKQCSKSNSLYLGNRLKTNFKPYSLLQACWTQK